MVTHWVVLSTSYQLKSEELGKLITCAKELINCEAESLIMQGENFTFNIITTGKNETVGSFSGQCFWAEIVTDRGEGDVSFLLRMDQDFDNAFKIEFGDGGQA